MTTETAMQARSRKCTNSEPGTFNHECGKPATWEGTHKGGYTQRFCSDCAQHGSEARGIVSWYDLTGPTAINYP
jgi:hypothetical protein